MLSAIRATIRECRQVHSVISVYLVGRAIIIETLTGKKVYQMVQIYLDATPLLQAAAASGRQESNDWKSFFERETFEGDLLKEGALAVVFG